jgi:hypothetical protein
MQLSMKISIRFDTWIMFNFDQVCIVLNFMNLLWILAIKIEVMQFS